MYRILYLIACVVGLLLGVLHTSQAPAATEKAKKAVSILFFLLLVAFIALAIIDKAWIVLAIAVVIFLFTPGVGRTVTLLVTKRAKEIGALSWILTLLFIAAAVFAVSRGWVTS